MRRALLWSILVFGAVNAALLPVDSRMWLDEDRFVWDFKWSRMKPGRLVLLGDSQAMSGVMPSLLGGITNLGVPSQQPEGLIPWADRLPPETEYVVINTSAYFLFKSEVVQSFETYYRTTVPLSPQEILFAPGLAGRNTGDAVYRSIQALPILTFRDRLSPVLGAAVPLEELSRRRAKNEMIQEHLHRTGGFWTWRGSGERVCGRNIEPGPGGFVVFRPRPRAEKALRIVLEKLHARGIRTALVIIPFSRAWAAQTEPLIDERVRELSSRIAAETGSRFIEAPDRSQYEDMFHDWTHLDACGAEKYSKFLYEALREDFKKVNK